MKQVEERYISLLTDFGFKRIFGTAMNKDLLICFLNSLFNGKQVVKDVSYLNPEHVGDVYTLCCHGRFLLFYAIKAVYHSILILSKKCLCAKGKDIRRRNTITCFHASAWGFHAGRLVSRPGQDYDFFGACSRTRVHTASGEGNCFGPAERRGVELGPVGRGSRVDIPYTRNCIRRLKDA